MDCGALDAPDHGDVSLTGTTFDSTATYSCSDGYVLEGEQTRTCQADTEWSGTAPHCRRKCPHYPIYSQVNIVLLQFLQTAYLVVVVLHPYSYEYNSPARCKYVEMQI